jgi:predicted ATPase/class 3 adenylate cyclase
MQISAGIVSFLFTDIEGSSQLWEQEPRRMSATMAAHDTLVRSAVDVCRGTVVKMTGDGMHAAFADPLDGLNAALLIQQAVADAGATNGVLLKIRCGLHVGVVERRDNDFFGRAVNRAARIMSIANGGQVLLSQAIVELVRDRLPPGMSLRDLGSVWLRDMNSQEHIYQLAHPRLPQDFPPLRTMGPARTNLPQQHTSFVGREAELEQVKELLRKHRLVSLVGSGGIGKTRLALQAGNELQAQFPDGAWFIDLAPLAAPDQVAEVVASIFPVAEAGSRSATEALITSLRQKQLLLILDNCEHVLSEVAPFVSGILKKCPDVTILVTSREPLSVQGEYAWRVQPLPFPEDPQQITAEQAMQYGAVRLFVERGEAALGTFAITDPIAPVVAEICKRLDGIALAIELAVPRLKILKPDELLARLKERFQLLKGGDRTALPRQQTLLAATDWSYRLLNEQEQILLRRLAVFPDTFTIDSAQGVGGDPPIDGGDVLDLVAALVDKSLVVPVVTTNAASRYKLLESTREFSLARLRESGDTGRQRRLAEYFIRTYEEAERVWDAMPDTQWYDTYEPDLDNVRATLAWAFGPDGDALLGIALVAHTRQLVQWWRRTQRQRWFEMAGARLDDSVPLALVGRVKLGLASCAGAHVGQRKGFEEALRAAEIFRQLGDAKNRAWALTVAADSIIRSGNAEEAESYYQEAEALLRPLELNKQLASVLASRAVARGLVAGDTASARLLFEESLSLARSLGYRRLIDTTSIHLAELDAVDGRLDAAIARAREAEAANRDSGNERFLNVTLANLTGYFLAVGDVGSARAAGTEALRLARSHGDSFLINVVVERLALAAALSGDATLAARLAGYCNALYHLDSTARESIEQRTWLSLMSHLDAMLTPAAKDKLMAEGAAWNEEQAAAAALAE